MADVEQRVFDQPHAIALAEAKAQHLRQLLPELGAKADLRVALDVGCGLGYFSGLLGEMGFAVQAIDARPENIAEARSRYPNVHFQVYDIEDPSVAGLGSFDIVLCLGLLYHLENPFRAIRNLAALTRSVCVVETVIAPYASPIAAFVEEGVGEDQGLSYLAQIPSESWLLRALSKAGFTFLYGPPGLPHHPDFRSLLFRKRRRTVIIASKVGLPVPALKRISAPEGTGRFIWYSFGIGKLLDHASVRDALKTGMKRISRHSQEARKAR